MTVYPIPDVALDDRLGWIGTSGSGKTYNAGGGVERLLKSGARVVIVDPLGVWYGLRLLADGKSPSPFNVAIFGGPHGDLPLNEHVGALIGETAATMAESCIVDLSEFGSKASDRRFMVAFLETLYRKAGGDPFHLVVDEADLFAPQKPGKGDEVLLGHMENIVRRGRVKGFMPWLISQRPAVLNKNVLSQVDGLVAFMLTASHDRNALDSWIEGQADPGQGKQIKDSLPTLAIGTGVVWLPRRSVLETVQFPPKLTFDSSRTPKRGEKRQRRELKPLDLDRLKDKLASIEEEAKANDPRALKAEVARLTRELAAAQKAAPAAWPDQREEVRQLKDEVNELRGHIEGAEDRLGRIAAIATNPAPGPLVVSEAWRDGRKVYDRCQPTEKPTRVIRDGYLEDGKTLAPPVARQPQRQPARIRDETVPAGDGSVPSGCAKPLAALAGAYPAGLTEAQWSMVAGYKKTGGTWNEYRRRLMRAGMIEQRGNLWYATDLGAEAAGPVELPPSPGPELVRWWAPKIQAPMHVVDKLIEVYPDGYTRAELADQIGMAVSGGSFQEYVRRLLRNSIAEERDGRVHLSDEVMGR